MTAQAPLQPKIYHIVHVDRLSSIIADGYLWCDTEMAQRSDAGTIIGMNRIKERRLKLSLDSRPDLHVGACVPFYFCPRSVMLYVIHQANHPALTYRDGQEPIVHLEADLHETIAWADAHSHRWAFTTGNAAATYSESYSDLSQLNRLDWAAIHARSWADRLDEKQAEFLIERSFPWALITCIGVLSSDTGTRTLRAVQASRHRPPVEVKQDWYY